MANEQIEQDKILSTCREQHRWLQSAALDGIQRRAAKEWADKLLKRNLRDKYWANLSRQVN